MEKKEKIERLSKLMRALEGTSIEDVGDLLYLLNKFIAHVQLIKETEEYEKLFVTFLDN